MTIEEALRILSLNPKDSDAWEVIALDVYQGLLAYVASLLLTFKVGPSETADDIVHEVLLSFYERWTSDRPLRLTSRTELLGYLRVSSRNLMVDKYRRERRAEQLVDFLTLKFNTAFKEDSNLYRSLFLDELITKLPPKCAAIFSLYVSEDLSLAEIADRLEESPSKFYSRWYRCLEQAKTEYLKKKTAFKR